MRNQQPAEAALRRYVPIFHPFGVLYVPRAQWPLHPHEVARLVLRAGVDRLRRLMEPAR